MLCGSRRARACRQRARAHGSGPHWPGATQDIHRVALHLEAAQRYGTRSHDYFTNCKSYPVCWEDPSQHNSSSGAFIYTANGTLGQRVQVLRDDSGRGDSGSRWRAAASVPGMYWATLWAPPGARASEVFLMGVSYGTRSNMSVGRSIVIARSRDYGTSFTKPVVLFPGSPGHGYSGAPTPNLIGSDGRIYRAYEASGGEKVLVMTKAPFHAGVVDLLDPSSWEITTAPRVWSAFGVIE